MAKRALLDDLIDGIDLQSVDVTAYFDCDIPSAAKQVGCARMGHYAPLRQIRARGAFRRIKEQLDRSGLLERWFAFKRDALREHAIEWCRDNDIPFE